MSNQLTAEMLSMMYDNTDLFYVSNYLKNKSATTASEPVIEYACINHAVFDYSETVFVLSKGTNDLLKTELKEFYSKFITALSLNEKNISMVLFEELDEKTFSNLTSDKNVKSIICWGVDNIFPITQPKYISQIHQKKQLLMVDPMEEIAADQILKMKLWKAVKQVFK